MTDYCELFSLTAEEEEHTEVGGAYSSTAIVGIEVRREDRVVGEERVGDMEF